jgi:hypothetical protein
MMQNRGLLGWVVAGVLAVALVGVIIYEASSGGESRSAAIGGGGQGQGPPPEVAAQVNDILDAKNKAGGKDHLPTIPPGQKPTDLPNNPPQQCDPNAEPNAMAEWKNHAHSLAQAKGMADDIIVGEVQSVEAATPFTSKVEGEPGGVVETPVQDVTIKVDTSVKGNKKEGDVVTVQRLGDAAGCFRVVGDPPFAKGEKYLLMLENGFGNRPEHAIAPEGRYKVHPDGGLEAVTKNPVAEEVVGDRLDQVISKLKG